MYHPQVPQLEIWQARWSSLDKTIDDMSCWMSEIEVDRKETVQILLQCLKAFGGRHFNFFYEAIKKANLERDQQYPPDFVLRRAIDQISFDLSTMQKACTQRFEHTLNDRGRQALNRADVLAYRALQPAITGNLLPQTTAVTYFQKQASVRIIPYAPVALIGIPYTTLPPTDHDTTRDYLTIPHEIGHYVYWHGKKNKYPLHAKLQEQQKHAPDWVKHWLEELFADVYACLIAGPVAALSFQDLLVDNDPQKLDQDDGEHPTPLFRPYIFVDILAVLGYGNEAQALEQRWQTCLRTWEKTVETVHPRVCPEPILLADARETQRKVIRDILHLLEELRNHSMPIWSTHFPNAGKDCQWLYQDFVNYIDKIQPPEHNKLPELAVKEDKVIVSDLPTGCSEEQGGFTPGRTEGVGDIIMTSTDVFIPKEYWTLLLQDQTPWTVSGPEADPHPKSLESKIAPLSARWLMQKV